MLFSATNNAVYSLFAFAKSLHTITIAMHLAKPIKINPDIYSGSFRKNRMAKPNIKTVPITQFSKIEIVIIFLSFNAFNNQLYSPFAIGGYSIKINRMANGTLVVRTERELVRVEMLGKK